MLVTKMEILQTLFLNFLHSQLFVEVFVIIGNSTKMLLTILLLTDRLPFKYLITHLFYSQSWPHSTSFSCTNKRNGIHYEEPLSIISNHTKSSSFAYWSRTPTPQLLKAKQTIFSFHSNTFSHANDCLNYRIYVPLRCLRGSHSDEMGLIFNAHFFGSNCFVGYNFNFRCVRQFGESGINY